MTEESSAVDGLQVLQGLREQVIKGRPIEVEGDNLVFKGASNETLATYSKHTPTAFAAKSGSGKNYDLLACYTCFRHASLNFSEYVKCCRSEKATVVSTVDKKELLAYLKGDIETSSQIQTGEQEKENVADTSKDPEKELGKRESSTPVDAPVKKRRTDEKEESMARIAARESSVRTRTSVLMAKKSFEGVLKTVETVDKELKEQQQKANKASAQAPVTAKKEQKPLHRLMEEKLGGTPIIVVPAGFSDLFTMLNARDFLEDGSYVPNSQKKKEGERKKQMQIIHHEEQGHTYTFKLVDNVSRFREKDWRRVVGVIVSGQAWQFKGWKWKFPLEVFKKACGIYVHPQGSQISDEIKRWDVRILMIHPDKRHLDKVAAREFWRYLFSFLQLKFQSHGKIFHLDCK